MLSTSNNSTHNKSSHEFYINNGSETPLKKLKNQSILKKTPSRSSRKSSKTPLKNVKFNAKVNVNQFFSSPEEKYHEILVNSVVNIDKIDENRLFADEFLFKAAESSIDKKGLCLEDEIQGLDYEIQRLLKENQELAKLIDNEKQDFRKKGLNLISEAEIEQSILQNKSLQDLINEKMRENDVLKVKMQDSLEESPEFLEKKIQELETANISLEKKFFEMKGLYEQEVGQFRLIGKGFFTEDFRKSIELELEEKEQEIAEVRLKIENLDYMGKWEKNKENFSLEVYLLICVEFERLNGILERKREENRQISVLKKPVFY